MADEEEEFDEEITSDFNIWLPEGKGSKLIGNVLEIDPESLYGLALQIEDDTGEVWQTPAHKQLQTLLKSLVVDDRVKIVHMGTEVAKTTGRKMNVYTLHRKGIDTQTGLEE